ncbi:hypothetical protein BHE74_00005641 [Ensete ventricosum]|uniref:Uncharacterized protein n=1 Tax=Ensete ventricosum TaxID=4639 RepID=A0A444DML7_ENSVE|nr:hypothetical protein B296_00017416 [Ensete ventricosum]RWV99343.1 hypothetical protein GW17_00037754 [Ensete ventricosum]RWW85655.1 hypothetical protein BHE74_00005641 [Ensete ventricosum]RZR78117.1 hypothetical protein BHM03_00003376 [Ensete ventricosum]
MSLQVNYRTKDSMGTADAQGDAGKFLIFYPRGTYDPSEKRLITIKKFISVVDELCLPSFRIVDLEQVIIVMHQLQLTKV